MKGLILKDLYSVKHQITLGVLLCIFPSFLLFCMTLGYANGDGKEGGEWFVSLCFALVNYCTITLCSSFCVNTVCEDASCGWLKLVGTMPITPKTICLSKIFSSLIVLIILTLVTALPNIFALAKGVGSPEVLIAAPVCSMLLQIAVMSPVFPFAIRFGGKKTSPFYIIVLLVLIIALTAAIILSFRFKTPNALRVIFYAGIPLAAAASVVLSAVGGRKMLVEK